MSSGKCPGTCRYMQTFRSQEQSKSQDYGVWNPVMWSDYPKQPMWTVPLPKIPAPVSVCHNVEPPRPQCQYPPADIVRSERCPRWVPGMPYKMSSTWNPFVNEDNVPYSTLVGPRYC